MVCFMCSGERYLFGVFLKCIVWRGMFFYQNLSFFIPIVFNFVEGYEIIKGRQVTRHMKYDVGVRKRLKKMTMYDIMHLAVYDITYLTVFIALYFFPYMINGFSKGNNHYSSQFSHLFPIGINTVICCICCCIFYIAFHCKHGHFAICRIGMEKKNEYGYKGRFWNFIFLSIIFLVFEIVIMIVLTEEGNVLIPHKYLFRYFQIFTVPLLLAFVSSIKIKEIWENKKNLLLLGMACIIVVLYWIVMYQRTSHGIIDGHFFVLLENANRVIPYAGAIIIAGLSSVVLGWLIRRNMRFLKLLTVSVVMCFWFLNCVQLPYYSNVIACGAGIESDAIKIAEHLNTNDISSIYYVQAKTANPYLQNCYGYFKQSFTEIELDQVENYAHIQGNAFIIPIDSSMEKMLEKFGLERMNLETELLNIYVAEDFK